DRYEQPPPHTPFSVFPLQIDQWHGVQEAPLSDDVLKILGVNDYLTRAYFTPDRLGLGVYIGYWNSQRQGDTIHSPQNCLPGAGWVPVSQRNLQFADPRGAGSPKLTVNRYLIQKGLDRM